MPGAESPRRARESSGAAVPLVVPDSSAIVEALVSSDALGDAIARRLAASALVAPPHLPVEIDTVLRGLERGGRLSTAQAGTAREVFASLPIEYWDWSLIGGRAWELRANVSTSDAGYVALAERLDAVLVTADARLGRATGIRCRVEVVEAEAHRPGP